MIPVFVLLLFVYFVLVLVLFVQLFLAIKKKVTNRFQSLVIVIVATILAFTFFNPNGIIDFDKLQGNNLLVAVREGSANCTTTLKLKDNFTFRERSVCFGVTEIKGEYHLQNDTIHFTNVKLDRDSEYYKFAVVRPTNSYNSEIIADLIFFKNLEDTTRRELWITKNELIK